MIDLLWPVWAQWQRSMRNMFAAHTSYIVRYTQNLFMATPSKQSEKRPYP